MHPYKSGHCLKHGRLYVNDRHCFLKTGKPLRNYGDADEVGRLIEDLPILVGKGYTNVAINCYWHHFNPTGDGRIEVSVEPLRALLESIEGHGLYISLSVETYGVGGGQIPRGFWERNPSAVAMNHQGEPVRDTEYGYNTAVPSIFSREYLEVSRAYISNLVRALGAERFLYFETTVEPQYMGSQWLDYSEMARAAYTSWAHEHPEEHAPPFPDSFPASEAFMQSKAWNRFRAQSLANWIDGDARAIKAGAGNDDIWIAVDYLDAEEDTNIQRLGDPLEMLRNLREANILQINWSWCNIARKPNLRAYQRVQQVLREAGKDWAITEHMTVNGADYFPADVEGLLVNTLANGTRFGWEFVDIAPDRDDPATQPNDILPGDFKPQHFSLYGANWQPKPVMELIESQWESWMQLATDKHNLP